jgi:hypothetical protein
LPIRGFLSLCEASPPTTENLQFGGTHSSALGDGAVMFTKLTL